MAVELKHNIYDELLQWKKMIPARYFSSPVPDR